MDRPKLDKPRLELWKTDDAQLSKFLEFVKKKHLNVSKWEFRIPSNNKMVSYQALAENIQERYPEFVYIEALRMAFLHLPDQMRIIVDELFGVFKRFTINFQERLNFIIEQEKYIEHLEKQIKKLSSKTDKERPQARNDETIRQLKDEIDELKLTVSKLKTENDFIAEKPKAKKEIYKPQRDYF